MTYELYDSHDHLDSGGLNDCHVTGGLGLALQWLELPTDWVQVKCHS